MADVVVWAALFPFMSDSSPALGELCSLFPVVHRSSFHTATPDLLQSFLLRSFLLPSYPAAGVETLPSLCFPGEWKCVKTWFDRGALVHGFQSAAQKVLQGKGLQGMKSYMQRQPGPQSSQSRETAPCNSSPAEVLAGSLGSRLDSKLLVENIKKEKGRTHLEMLLPNFTPQETCSSCLVFQKVYFFFPLNRCTNTFCTCAHQSDILSYPH